jgi:hypothetical protein
MKLVKMGIALIVATTCFSGLRAQTVDEIVNKYVDAIGGKDKLAKVKTVYIVSTSQVMGNEGPSTTTVVNGVGYKIVTEMSGQTYTIVFTDKGGWQVNPYAGATTPTPFPEAAAKLGKEKLDAFGPLYNYVAKGNKVELQGKEGSAFKLKVTSPESGESTVFIDTASFYMTKLVASSEFMGQTIDVITSFSNFKKGDMDIVFPNAVDISYGGQFNITNTVNKIELNKTIDPAIFEMPKS